MNLMDIVTWLQGQDNDLIECVSAGCIDGNKKKWIGVYHAKRTVKQRMCIGGAEMTGYGEKYISLLVHWTEKPVEAEKKASKIQSLFYGVSNTLMGSTHVILADPGPPIPVGKDNKGIYEYIIEIKMTYERVE